MDEEFGSHLVMIDSAFSMFSSIMDSVNLWVGVNGMGEFENEVEEVRDVLDDEKKRANIHFLAMWVLLFLFGVSDKVIRP